MTMRSEQFLGERIRITGLLAHLWRPESPATAVSIQNQQQRQERSADKKNTAPKASLTLSTRAQPRIIPNWQPRNCS